jgi:BolA protein
MGMQGKEPIETHFVVEVVSDAFQGKRLIERHRLVYGILGDELRASVHALNIKALTPLEVETKTK